jgi:hypothetical protein
MDPGLARIFFCRLVIGGVGHGPQAHAVAWASGPCYGWCWVVLGDVGDGLMGVVVVVLGVGDEMRGGT